MVQLTVPTEPPDFSVVLASDDVAWQRRGELWVRVGHDWGFGNGLPWVMLLAKDGPVRVIHWAPVEEAA